MPLGLAKSVIQSMANHRKHRGYRTQKVIADYLKQWWEYADTAGAGRQGEDILNIPSISIEVKARADFQPLAWIKQAARASHKGGPRVRTPDRAAPSGVLPCVRNRVPVARV